MKKNEYYEYRDRIIEMIESLGYVKTKFNDPKYLPKTYRKNRGDGIVVVPKSGVHIYLLDWNEHFNYAPIVASVSRNGRCACSGCDISHPKFDAIGLIKGEISVDNFIDSIFENIGI